MTDKIIRSTAPAVSAQREAPAAESPRRDYAQRIVRPALHDEVVARLRGMILEGELAPGSRINEKQLCELFGISRTPFREALRVLATEGLIEVQPHRGATVAKFSADDIEHMFHVMAVLEGLAGELACTRVTDSQLAEVQALHEAMRGHFEREERPEYFRLNRRIHEKIVEIAGNPVLADLYGRLSQRINRARYLANLAKPRWQQAMAEHELILEALAARDGERLCRILRDHMLHKMAIVKVVLTREDAPA